MFLAVLISRSYEFCSDGKGNLYTSHVGYFKRHLPICIVSTDRHVSIKKLMKIDERFRHMLYQFDPWYVGKNILKKLWKLLRRKVIFFFILLANLLYLVVMP